MPGKQTQTNPNSLKNLKQFTKETGVEMARRGVAARKNRSNLASQIANAVSKRMGNDEYDAVYVAQAFPGAWAGLFKQTLRGLKKQYTIENDTQQYRILVTRAAALYTSIQRMEAEKVDADLVLRVDAQLRGYVQALQKYTEAEKRELVVQNEVILTTLTRVVSIAESVIGEPVIRANFMRALAAAVDLESIHPAPLSLPIPEPGVYHEIPSEGESAESNDAETSEG